MTTKEWPMAFGERGGNPNPAVESIRQAQAEKQVKQTKRDDELAEIEHKRKLAEEEAKAAEARKKSEEAAAGGAQQPLTFKPVEIDIQAGEKAAEERAKSAEEQAQRERDEHGKTREELAGERQKRLEDKLGGLTEELKAIRGGKGGGRTADEVIDEAVKTAEKLGYAKGGTPAVSAEVQVQLQKMQNDLQIRLEEMKDERDRRDKEWQLTLRKWDEEREQNRGMMAQRQKEHEDRMNMLNTAITRFGRVAAQTIKGGGEGPGGVSAEAEKTFYIDADEGEEGETACPKCGETIFIAPDAAQVICSSCGLTAEVRRTPSEPKSSSKSKKSE